MAEDHAKLAGEDEKFITLEKTNSKRLLQRLAALCKSLDKLKRNCGSQSESVTKEIHRLYSEVALKFMPLLQEVGRNLDDAVLCSLPQTGSKPKQIVTKAEMDSVVRSAVALCLAMGIEFKLEALYYEPFYHGYGECCRDGEITFGVWPLPIVDLNGNKIAIPFYITKRSSLLILGKELLSKSDILNTQKLLRITPTTIKGLKTEAHFPIYTTQDAKLRTHLHVVPCPVSKIRDYFASFRSLHGAEKRQHLARKERPRFMGKTAKEFAKKLHLYSHLPLRDMKKLYQRGGILHPSLIQALHNAVEKCSSCNTTGRPLNV